MNSLFTEEIHNLDDWAKIFTKAPVFAPLTAYIFAREQLPFAALRNTTPGTHAVFQVGTNLIKLFAPVQCGTNSKLEYENELLWLELTAKLGIKTPKVVAWGKVRSRYVFRYIVMEYLPYPNLNEIKHTLTLQQKREIALQLQDITEKIQNIATDNVKQNNSPQISNGSWNGFSKQFLREREVFLKTIVKEAGVWVHGDLTGDNILVAKDNTVYIIDFADAKFTHRCYDLPPLILDAFSCDMEFIHSFCGNKDTRELEYNLLIGLLTHDFGGELIKTFLTNRVGEIETIVQLKEMIKRKFT